MALTKVSGGGLKDVDLGSENLTTTGSVGIGTSSPSSLLNLSGSAPKITLTSTSTGADSILDATSSFGSIWIGADENNEVASSQIVLGVDGSPKVSIKDTGNVGIGTANPSSILHLQGTDTAYSGGVAVGAILTVSDTAGRTIEVVAPGSVGEGGIGTSSNHDFTFFTANTEKVRLDQSGRLLVGLTSGTSAQAIITDGLQVTGAASDGNTSRATLDYSSSTARLMGHNSSGGQIAFFTNASGSGVNERFRISSTGAWGLSGENYGTSGQVLTSQGSSAAPQWATPAGGKILQVVQTIKTDTDSSTSTTFVDISGLSATITPSSTSSKILVFVGIGCASSQYDQRGVLYRILRGSTPIGQGDNAQTGPCGWGQMSYESYVNGSHSPVILDSPATTSATTYKVQWHISAGMTFYLNRTYSGTTGLFQRRAASTITLMEVQG